MTAAAAVTPEDVPHAFDAAAHRYDVMVRLNPGYHQHLSSAAEALVKKIDRPPGHEPRVVDLGCGSGASTQALVSRLDAAGWQATIVGIDASEGMLRVAASKDWGSSVTFAHGLAEDLSASRGDWGLVEPVDGLLAAYLFRNVTERDKVLDAVHDLLVPGGVLAVQEYSVAGSRRAAVIWSLICWLVVIPLSWVTTKDTTLYRYLWRSVRAFDTVDRFVERMQQAGFVDVEVKSVPGWQRGILHTFRGRKVVGSLDG